MSAEIIDGKAIAEEVRREVAADVAAWVAAGNEPPGLATVLVGEDPASAVYVGGKQKATHEVGMQGFDHRLAADTPQAEVEALLESSSTATRACQRHPAPAPDARPARRRRADLADRPGQGRRRAHAGRRAGRLAKGRPGCGPARRPAAWSCSTATGVELEGAEAVVVGRSDLVGKPIAQMLLARDATVTICHSRTRDLPDVCRRADVLVAAVGRARMVQGDWVKPGATVIDVGINRTDDGLVGDVDFDAAAERAARITPVPRGVGPMTIAMLLRNTLEAARASAGAPA